MHAILPLLNKQGKFTVDGVVVTSIDALDVGTVVCHEKHGKGTVVKFIKGGGTEEDN